MFGTNFPIDKAFLFKTYIDYWDWQLYDPLDHGYSIEMKEKSVNTFSFPNGEYWSLNK